MDHLRFSDETFLERFGQIESMPEETLEDLREGMREYINQFSEEVSVGKLLAYMDAMG